MKIKTLADYMSAAALTAIPDWAADVEINLPGGASPAQHQIKGLNFAAQFARSGNLDEPGLGKTLIAQAHAAWLIGMGNKHIAIMSPVLVEQYVNSFHRVYKGIEKYLRIEAWQGTIKQRQALLDRYLAEGFPDVLVMSYKMFTISHLHSEKFHAHDAKGNPRFTATGKPLIKKRETPGAAEDVRHWGWRRFMEQGYNSLTVDEATAIKSASSEIHKAVMAFANDGKHGIPVEEGNGVLLLSGFPVENNLLDAYGFIAINNPRRYGNFKAFEHLHVLYVANEQGIQTPAGFMNHDYMYTGLYSTCTRTLKKDVLDLPPRTIIERSITLSPSHKAKYDELVQERVLELPEGGIVDATSASAFYQTTQRILCNPEMFDPEGTYENEVINNLEELLDELNGRKVVIYCWYTDTIRKFAELFKDKNPAILFGDVTGKARQENIHKFVADPTCQVILANPKSGGVGVDGFQHVCQYAIFVELVPIPGLFYQACDRLYRTGQANPVTIYVFTIKGTVSVRLRNNLVRKEEESNRVVRDKRTLLADLMGREGIQGELL